MKYLYLYILLLAYQASQAQPIATNPDYKKGNVWHFGSGAGLDFNGDTVKPKTDGVIYTL
jgi:hypothetical protein